MYSPKISEELIPVIFQVALAKKIPMTKLVNGIIRDYLEKNGKVKGGLSDDGKRQVD